MFKKVLLVTAISALTTVSNAALTIYSNDGVGIEGDSSLAGGNYQFYQKGLSSDVDFSPKGFGRGMPLSMASEIILPDGWEATFKDNSGKLPVDWNGDKKWTKVLEDLSKENNLIVSLDWDRKAVNFVSKDMENERIKRLESEMQLAKNMQSEKENTKSKNEEEKDLVAKNKFKDELDKLKAQEAKMLKEMEEKEKMLSEYKKMFEKATVLPGDGTFEAYLEMVKNDKKISSSDEAIFIVDSSLTLKENLNYWAEQMENWKFVDNTMSSKQFTFPTDIKIKGKFVNVTSELISKYEDSNMPLDVEYYVADKNMYVLELKRFNYNF